MAAGYDGLGLAVVGGMACDFYIEFLGDTFLQFDVDVMLMLSLLTIGK